jgi:hypothetical protein
MREYFHSFDNEVYPLILPQACHDMLFEEVSLPLPIMGNSSTSLLLTGFFPFSPVSAPLVFLLLTEAS